jgi:hypothetical protein
MIPFCFLAIYKQMSMIHSIVKKLVRVHQQCNRESQVPVQSEEGEPTDLAVATKRKIGNPADCTTYFICPP